MANDFESLVQSYVNEVQELDTAARDMLPAVSLGSAEGVQLDGLGEIIGVERNGLDDETYRARLRAQIQVNTSGGTIEQVLAVAVLTSGVTTAGAVVLTEGTPAEFIVEITEKLDAGVGAIVAEAVYQARAAGVYGITQYHETEPVFAFDGSGSSKFDGGYYLRGALRNGAGRESEVL